MKRSAGDGSGEPALRSAPLRAVLAGTKVLVGLAALSLVWATLTGTLRFEAAGRSGRAFAVLPQYLSAFFVLLIAGAVVLGLLAQSWGRSATAASDLTVDEGGIRWRQGTTSGYVLLEDVSDVSVAGTLAAPAIVVQTKNGKQRFWTGGRRAADLVAEIYPRLLASTRARETVATEVAATLGRRGRDLETWLRSVREAAGGPPFDATYRTAATTGDVLFDVFANGAAAPEHRAAAVHALLARGDDAVSTDALARLGASTPPLVVVAAAMAAPDRVDPRLLDAALPFVSPEDRQAAAAAAGSPPTPVAVEPARVRVELGAAAEDDRGPAAGSETAGDAEAEANGEEMESGDRRAARVRRP